MNSIEWEAGVSIKADHSRNFVMIFWLKLREPERTSPQLQLIHSSSVVQGSAFRAPGILELQLLRAPPLGLSIQGSQYFRAPPFGLSSRSQYPWFGSYSHIQFFIIIFVTWTKMSIFEIITSVRLFKNQWSHKALLGTK